MKAVLLVGGLGTRLRSVAPSRPKPLVSIGDRPFLDLLVRQLRKQGIRRLVMCTGHLADQIETEFGSGQDFDVEIAYSREASPLGTAGALKLARHHLDGAGDFLVLNGDSFLEIDFRRLIEFHQRHGGCATMGVVRVPDARRYGTIVMDQLGRVSAFSEKASTQGPGIINAGVYLFDQAVLDCIPDGAASLERDVFPQLLDRGVYALEQHGMFIDIGTPEDYVRAQGMLDRLNDAVCARE